ncbi:MAG: flagellar biosynthetic protein FliR [Oscillospiraceae bacterium]
MIDWTRLTLLLYVLMRMTGFVLFNPILGRRGIPGMVRSGLILILTVTVMAMTRQTVPLPSNLLSLMLRLLLELTLGYLLGLVMNIFFAIPIFAGEMIDSQMGLTMAKTYDAGSQSSMSVTATLLNLLMVLLFFTAGGHNTLFRILLTSGDLIPFGSAALGANVTELLLELFVECMVLAVKLALPILAAELMAQVGMGILMKAIPQINVFSINIELKVVIGLVLIFLLLSPFTDFLLDTEVRMLAALRQALSLAH